MVMGKKITNSKRDSLRKILIREKLNGFGDTTVMGGLDRFLQRWGSELSDEIGEIDSYSSLSIPNREAWVEAALARTSNPLPPDVLMEPSVAVPRQSVTRKEVLGGGPLDTGVASLKSVAKQTLPKLKRMGVEVIRDLV